MRRKVAKPTAYVFIPDLHFPATDWSLIENMRDYCNDLEEDFNVKYIQLGDWLDAKAWGKWAKSPDDDGPQTEFDKAYADMERMHSMFPKMTLICGNHCLRPLLRASEAGLPSQLLKTLDEIFPFDGWYFHTQPDPLYIKELDCYVLHGDEMGGTAEQKAKQLGSSVIQGHTHKGKIAYINRVHKKQTFAVEAGCIIDVNHKAFRYSSRNPINSFLGFCVVIDGVPQLVPVV